MSSSIRSNFPILIHDRITGYYKIPANILNLPAYKVLRVEETEHDYHISAEIAQTPTHCRACGHDCLLGHGRNEQIVRDLLIHGNAWASTWTPSVGGARRAARPSWSRCQQSTPSGR
ncbi:hypothetical protein THIARS_90137 [Thiomonas delicata]|uniref:Transposase IS204/IS1001/IS1096/IS1165 zinc-finger domain-containing protein n=1 Tax=Thiomonas delicata TaxID=364030 RepID=A0A238D9K0_THIDL|nr:hypothetical protein THIARS_90137 [Thiomonas delicata]